MELRFAAQTKKRSFRIEILRELKEISRTKGVFEEFCDDSLIIVIYVFIKIFYKAIVLLLILVFN